MSLKSFFDKLREEEKKRQQAEQASLNTDVNVFKNKSANTQSSTVKATAKSGAGTASKAQSNTAKNTRNTDAIDMDWGLNAQTYADMTSKLKKASVNKSTDMIDNDYGFNVKAMDDYLAKMRSGRKAEADKGAAIYDDVGDKLKDNKYASTMINIGKSFSDFGKYNHLNDLYYINNPTGVDDGYKYINKEDMNKYFYALASHEKGDVDKKDVDDLKKYLFGIGVKIDSKEADELPEIKHKPDYSKISSEEQLIYDSFGNAVNKAKSIDYSKIPTDDQLPKELGKVKVNKSTDAVDRDYGLDLSSYKDMMNKNKSGDTNKPKRDIDYSKISSDEQLIYDSFGNAVNKAKGIDYSGIPTDDQLPKEPGKVKVDKSTEAVDRDYGLDLSSYKDMMSKNKTEDNDKPKKDIDYSKISSDEQLIYDSYGNAVNKAKSIDYSGIPTDDQLPKEPGKVKVNKSTDAVDRDYGLDLSQYKNMISKINPYIAYSDGKSYNENNGIIIFQSPKQMGKNEKGALAEDLIINNSNYDDLLDINPMFKYQLNEAYDPASGTYDGKILFQEWEDMATSWFSSGDMEQVVKELINNFKTGEKDVYSNPILTKYVSKHPATQNYINTVKSAVIDELVKNNGNLTALKFDKNTKEDNELYNLINATDYPKFDTIGDILGGLTMSINDTQGNDVQVLNYSIKDGNFQGTLRFHIYDDFGLDEYDVNKDRGKLYVKLAGFRAWYTLQHFEGFNGKYKPFTTEVVIDVPFEGELRS